MPKGKLAYFILGFVVVAIWGITFISTKVLVNSGLLPSQIFAIRFTVAYAGIWILCLLPRLGGAGSSSRRLWSNDLPDELIFVLLGVSGGSMYFLTENTALACAQACNVSFIVCSAPLLTVIMTMAFRKLFAGKSDSRLSQLAGGLEDVRISWRLVGGTALAIGGMAAVLFDARSASDLPASAFGSQLKGEILALAAAFCWALYSLFMSQMTEKYGAVFATRKVFFYGLVTIIPFLIGQPLDLANLARPVIWGNLLFLSLFASLACFVAWNKVMSKIGNVTATNYVYLNPFFTLLFAALILGESLTLQAALGCVAIISGVILGSKNN